MIENSKLAISHYILIVERHLPEMHISITGRIQQKSLRIYAKRSQRSLVKIFMIKMGGVREFGGYVRINDDETTRWSDIVGNLWNFDGSQIEDAFDDLSFVEGDFLGFVYSSGYPELANALNHISRKGSSPLYKDYKAVPFDEREKFSAYFLADDENFGLGNKGIVLAEIFCSLVNDYINKECEKNLLLQYKWLAEFLNGELAWHQAMQWKYGNTDD